MNFITELKNRLKEESPKFFQKIQKFGAWLTGIATSLLLLPYIPEQVKNFAGYALVAGIVLTGTAYLPVKDTSAIK